MPSDQIESGSNSDAQLKGFALRIQTLEEEKVALVERIAEEYAAAKTTGFDPKALKKAIKELGLDEDKRQLTLQFEWEVDAYRKALALPTREDLELKSARDRISARAAEDGTTISINNGAAVRGPMPEAKAAVEMVKRDKKKGKSTRHLEVVK